jgi:hypothetical protein
MHSGLPTGRGRRTLCAHRFDYEICWLNQFRGLWPKAASLLCLIDFCQPHPRLCCCQGSVYSHCQGCYPTCKHHLPGMENLLLPEALGPTLHAACFCLWLGPGSSDTRPQPSALSAFCFSFFLLLLAYVLIFTKAFFFLLKNY